MLVLLAWIAGSLMAAAVILSFAGFAMLCLLEAKAEGAGEL